MTDCINDIPYKYSIQNNLNDIKVDGILFKQLVLWIKLYCGQDLVKQQPDIYLFENDWIGWVKLAFDNIMSVIVEKW